MGSRIFWALVAGFLIGVFARSYLPLGYAYVLFLVLIACAAAVLASFDREKMRAAMILGVFLLACASGIVRMNVATLSGDPSLSARINTNITIEGTVSAEPDRRDGSVRVSIDADELVAPTAADIHAGVLAVLPPHTDVAYGDRVRAWGMLQAPTAFDTGADRSFAYPQYLAAQGIEYELSQANLETIGTGPSDPLLSFAIWTKETFLNGIAEAIPEPEAGLGGGITVGDKRSIGEELTTDFQNVGLVHIVVLSGYNITVVLNAVATLLRWAPRSAQFGASGFVVALFILMSGGASSASRAGLMALVAILARATGRTFLASRALAVAAVLLVAWNPFVLAFDPGFQLSALATVGLIVFSPLLSTWLAWIPERFALREIASSTLGTQLAVLPILLYQNGALAMYALPANLFALVAVPIAMFFTLIAGICGAAFGSWAVPVAFPAYLLLAYIIKVAEFFSSLPFASVSVGAFSALWMFSAYATLFSGAWFLHLKKNGRT